ncbi:MAG: hypothetical protein V1495_06275 [Pseudomonadota bacterium]
MAIKKIIDLLSCEIVHKTSGLTKLKVGGCFAADLMSDVLAFSKPGVVLLTGLTSIQSVHTADVADLPAIIYVSGKKLAPDVVEAARKKEISLLRTDHSLFDACGILREAGMGTNLK